VDAGSAARDGNIQTIVDDDPRSAPAREGDQLRDDRGKIARLEVAFAHLQVLDARIDRVTRLFNETSSGRGEILAAVRQPPAVGHEVEDQGSTRVSACGSSFCVERSAVL